MKDYIRKILSAPFDKLLKNYIDEYSILILGIFLIERYAHVTLLRLYAPNHQYHLLWLTNENMYLRQVLSRAKL